MTRTPRSGDLLRLDGRASCQFAVTQAIWFRVIRPLTPVPYETWQGWMWLDGYEVDEVGEALLRREVWVKIDGVRYLEQARDPDSPRTGNPSRRAGHNQRRSADRAAARLG